MKTGSYVQARINHYYEVIEIRKHSLKTFKARFLNSIRLFHFSILVLDIKLHRKRLYFGEINAT